MNNTVTGQGARRSAVTAVQRVGRRALARLDAFFNRLYTWRYNPLYHTGALVVAAFVVLVVTGLYLLLFYRISAPHASVERVAGQVWLGRWIRGVHRYASDLALVATAVHAFRMFVQDRLWGPRALAWISGVVLVGIFFLCGWTGYVMVWDTYGQLLAAEGARLFDVLPLFSEPISRTFVGGAPMPRAFFFLNLFAHIAVPVGLALFLWIHVSRLARTYLLPPRPLLWTTVGLLVALAVLWPAPLGREADLLRVPAEMPFDVLYGFWIPVVRAVPVGVFWGLGLAAVGFLMALPVVARPPEEAAPPPSYVHPRYCTGCEQCYHDCPYEAVRMVPRTQVEGPDAEGRSRFVGLVDPEKCVSCGICSGSCAPMGVGPAGRTGRDQVAEVRRFIEERAPGPEDVVVVGCTRSAAGWGVADVAGAPVFAVDCAGSLHSSVVEYLIRAGVGGVLVAACPPRDCWTREGVQWMEARLYEGREAELKDRVDRRRLRVVYAAEAELPLLQPRVERFRAQMRALGRALGERTIEIDTTCDVPEVSVAEEVVR